MIFEDFSFNVNEHFNCDAGAVASILSHARCHPNLSEMVGHFHFLLEWLRCSCGWVSWNLYWLGEYKLGYDELGSGGRNHHADFCRRFSCAGIEGGSNCRRVG